MTAIDMLLAAYLRRSAWTVANVVLAATASATSTVVPAPGAGRRLAVIDGLATSTGAGATTWYHTAVAAENRLTGVVNHSNNSSYRPGPWLLPANTPLVVVTVTTGVNGFLLVATVVDP